ncbi:MAG: L-aspartate oxidase [Gammaproteobacteria bacterium]|nr:L-aspartate oxidase [Gammaproteobacteria bacterium]
MTLRYETDVLVIGSGAAGLASAINLPPHVNVLVISKEDMTAGSTNRAQGGIAAVTDEDDSTDSHYTDTLMAGAGLCDPNAVRFVVQNGASAVNDLIEMGLQFDRQKSELHRTNEGGHSHRRVLHVADATGRAIASTLIEEARNRSSIEFMNDRIAVELITHQADEKAKRVVGAYVYDPNTDRVECIRARSVVLATGGASKVYLYTSNPDTCTGDGIAMAWRAGCRLSNMEFNQFHPTCLYHPEARSFLISEAVRGEGGKLRLPDGSTFMHRFDKRQELASRDIVARAIDYEIKRLGIECVYLDLTDLSTSSIETHFPTILQRLLDIGVDIRKEPIPVVPAAHYTCGGVLVDRHGRTDVDALYAVGEVACTGVHGANRLASNSLLECLVYAKSVAHHIAESLANTLPLESDIKEWDESRVTNSDENVVLTHNWMELRRFMWDYVGIVRTDNRLERAANRINLLKREVHEFYSHYRINSDLIELRNLINVAEAIVRGAQWRKESRGLHYTLDYPEQLRDAQPSIQYPPEDPLDVLQPAVAIVQGT